MQTLGLSDSSTRSDGRLKSLFWPSIQSGADVDYLAVQGFWVCTIVGVISLATLCFAGQPITGILVFLIFHIGGVGVREHNPFAAVVMLAYYGLDWLAAPGFSVVRIILTALLLSNVRATWISGGWKVDSEEAVLPPRLADTFFDKLADFIFRTLLFGFAGDRRAIEFRTFVRRQNRAQLQKVCAIAGLFQRHRIGRFPGD